MPGVKSTGDFLRHLIALFKPQRSAAPLAALTSGGDEHWFIDRWSCYRGAFLAQGWFLRPGAAITSIQLCEKVSHVPLANEVTVHIRLSSPDVQHAYGIAGKDCRFEVIAQLDRVDRALEIALKLTLDNGEIFHIDDPAAPAMAVDPYHQLRRKFFGSIGHGFKVLELGSRARSGNVIRGLLPNDAEYIGADIMAGPNVDVVCDAHRLSEYFQPNSVDAIFSVSVFEHLLMPWKVVLEANKILKRGGTMLTMTHQSFPPHDQPWDFWRFTDQAWHGLFNTFTGFEVVETAMGERLEMVADILTPITKGYATAPGFAGSAVISRKISDMALAWPASLDDIIRTAYPK